MARLGYLCVQICPFPLDEVLEGLFRGRGDYLKVSGDEREPHFAQWVDCWGVCNANDLPLGFGVADFSQCSIAFVIFDPYKNDVCLVDPVARTLIGGLVKGKGVIALVVPGDTCCTVRCCSNTI